jgi:hypothetical protein
MKEDKPVIALLVGMNLTAQNVFRTGVEFLEKQFEVVVFDCRPLLHRPIDLGIEIDPRFRRIYQLRSEEDLVSILQRLNPIYAIDFIGPCRKMKLIQPALRAAGCKFVIQKLDQQPQPNILIRRIIQFSTLIRHIFGGREHKTSSSFGVSEPSFENTQMLSRLLRPMDALQSYFQTRYFGIADIAVAAGSQATKSCSKLANDVVSVKSNDVHLFNESKRNTKFDLNLRLPYKFAVFIDDALIDATDWKLIGIDPPVPAHEYFSHLNSFFARIEAVLGIEVIIAGHPQCEGNRRYASRFLHRSVVFGDTPGLVLRSEMTIVHASTATSFAVLADKPIVIITSSRLNRSHYGEKIRNLAKSLKQKMIFMDRDWKKSDLEVKRINTYPRYINKLLYDNYALEIGPWESFLLYTSKK